MDFAIVLWLFSSALCPWASLILPIQRMAIEPQLFGTYSHALTTCRITCRDKNTCVSNIFWLTSEIFTLQTFVCPLWWRQCRPTWKQQRRNLFTCLLGSLIPTSWRPLLISGLSDQRRNFEWLSTGVSVWKPVLIKYSLLEWNDYLYFK